MTKLLAIALLATTMAGASPGQSALQAVIINKALRQLEVAVRP
ncbi:MAG: hypothetical protein ABIW30_03570 [Arenimonas sp.]